MLDGSSCLLPMMMDRRGIAEMLAEIRAHRFEHFRKGRRGSVVVEINAAHHLRLFYPVSAEEYGQNGESTSSRPLRTTCGMDDQRSALFDQNVRIRILRPQIFGPRTDQAIVVKLFDDVRRPAADAGDGKHWRK